MQEKMGRDSDDDFADDDNDPDSAQQQITDEDHVPLELFDAVVAQQLHKQQAKKALLVDFLKQCREEQSKKLKQLGIEQGR